MTRPGTRGLPGWQLEAFANDVPYGAECASEQLCLPACEQAVERPAPSPAAVFDAEARALADRIRADVAARPCRCDLPPPGVDERGRCTRCLGRRVA